MNYGPELAFRSFLVIVDFLVVVSRDRYRAYPSEELVSITRMS